MITNVYKKGNEYFKIIHRDIYKVRGWRDGSFDVIYDIGANIGLFSVFMKMRHPMAEVIAVEPSMECLLYLRYNVNMFNIKIEEIALGNGKPLYIQRRGHILDSMFVEQSKGYNIESITLYDLFRKYGGERYFLKFNCEGGEKYLIGDELSENIISNALQASFQVHYKTDDTPFEHWLDLDTYDKWFFDTFDKTHKIAKYSLLNKSGSTQYCLVKRK